MAAGALLLLAACGEDKGRVAARQLARRNACVASELALVAKEKLASLDTAAAGAEGTPLEQVTQASRSFSAAYRAWADASSRSAELADSAANASSRDDSVKYARMADQARPAAVPQGSMEGNAAASYNADVARAFGNPDHPCNKPQEEDGS